MYLKLVVNSILMNTNPLSLDSEVEQQKREVLSQTKGYERQTREKTTGPKFLRYYGVGAWRRLISLILPLIWGQIRGKPCIIHVFLFSVFLVLSHLGLADPGDAVILRDRKRLPRNKTPIC